MYNHTFLRLIIITVVAINKIIGRERERERKVYLIYCYSNDTIVNLFFEEWYRCI